MGRLPVALLSVAAFHVGFVTNAPAQPLPDAPYTAHGFGPLPFSTRSFGIDDAGDIVATSPDGKFLVVYRDGDTRLRPLLGPNGDPARAVAMNSRGDLLVWTQPLSLLVYNVRNQTYQRISFSVLDDQIQHAQRGLIAINAANQFLAGTPEGDSAVVGSFATRPLGATESATPTGTRTIRCPEQGKLYPTAINDKGQAVGFCSRSASPVIRTWFAVSSSAFIVFALG